MAQSWRNTGFVVVPDITSGRAGAVYLIYNFWRVNPPDDERDYINDDFSWGSLERYEEDADQFSVAKITNSLEDLGEYHKCLLTNRLTHEPGIVPVVQSAPGQPLVRHGWRENMCHNVDKLDIRFMI